MSSVGVHQVINPNYEKSDKHGLADWAPSAPNGRLQKRARLNARLDPSVLQTNVQNVLGDTVATTAVMSRNLDMMTGHPHSTTGIPYAIQGSAQVINVDVSEYLATFQDPLKAILSTTIHQEAKVIITRKYVVGGRSLITPEHAPARTVAIQEDAREVMMTRYGGDIEMNLNLFLRPEEAREELALKIGAQRRELERTLIEHGYSALMEEGTNIVDALIRSNPSYSSVGGSTNRDIVKAAERINISTVFGAMSKHPFPIANLLAAAKYASAYTTTNEKGSVLLLPHGTPDILRYTRKENMVFDISGPDLLQRNKGKPISMELENVYADPNTNVKILIQRNMPTFDSGVAHPDVGMGGLTDTSTFATFYNVHTTVGTKDGPGRTEVVDFENRCWATAGVDDAKSAQGAWRAILDYMYRRLTAEVPEVVRHALSIGDLSGIPGVEGTQIITNLCTAEYYKETNRDKITTAGVAIATLFREYINGTDEATDTREHFLLYVETLEGTEVLALFNKIEGSKPDEDLYDGVLVRPRMTAVMSSAILAAPGSETGELMIGYPFTSVSTSSTEVVKIQLRVYMGAVLKKPENVIIMRDVFFEGLRSGHTIDDLHPLHVPKKSKKNGYIDFFDVFMDALESDTIHACYTVRTMVGAGIVPDLVDLPTDRKERGSFIREWMAENEIPSRAYMGASRTYADDKALPQYTENNGHLGKLDHPSMVDRLYGSFVYNSNPDPKNH